MTVEIFTKEEFEKALPINKNTGEPMWRNARIIEGGEYCYLIDVDDEVAIMVRSSIDRSGISAESGQDSIRCWLVRKMPCGGTAPLGSKVSRWTTRIPGWQDRMTEVIRTLWSWRKKAGNCCGEPRHILKVKVDTPNKGRIFTKCNSCGKFTWLTEPKEKK